MGKGRGGGVLYCNEAGSGRISLVFGQDPYARMMMSLHICGTSSCA